MEPSPLIDFTRNPFRGIFAEVARETGRSRQAVAESYRLRNVDDIRRVMAKVREREAVLKEAQHARRA